MTHILRVSIMGIANDDSVSIDDASIAQDLAIH